MRFPMLPTLAVWLSAAAAVVLAAALALPALVSAQASPSQWRSTLIGANEVPPTTSTMTGFYEATLNEAAQTITWALTVPTITNATAAHLHFGAPTCACPVVLPMFAAPAGSPASIINVSGTSGPTNLTGPLAGKWDDFVTALKTGQIYVNAHSTQNPGGEVRGTLVLASAAPSAAAAAPAQATAAAAPKTGSAGIADGGSAASMLVLLVALAAVLVGGARILVSRRSAR